MLPAAADVVEPTDGDGDGGARLRLTLSEKAEAMVGLISGNHDGRDFFLVAGLSCADGDAVLLRLSDSASLRSGSGVANANSCGSMGM
jgi:hypothetical protein